MRKSQHATPITALIVCASIALLHQHPLLLLVELSVIVGLFLKYSHKSTRVFFCVATLIGFLLEYMFVTSGVWVYSNPHVLGIPLWIGFVWGFGAITFVWLQSVIEKYGK